MDDQYIQRLGKIEAVIDTWLPENPGVSWLKEIFGSQGDSVSPELAASLVRPGRDLVKRGGKRWRPLLMMLAAECLAGEEGGEAALPFTPLVEFSHNASLIHDDVEDNSDERRGKPAVHLIYGMDTAINSGTFMYFLSLACLSAGPGNDAGGGAARELKDRIWALWAGHIRALHLGQAMDIAWHRDYHSLPALAEYDRMCRLKTGCLARLAAILGVYCSGLPGNLKALEDIFGEAAEQLGVGFQILDDVKNLETGVPGKKRGDDIVEGKKSLPVLLYLHRYPEKRNFAARCFAAARERGIGAPEVGELIGALEDAGVLSEAREKGMEYIRGSGQIFSAPGAAGFSFNENGRKLLEGLVDMLGGESGRSSLDNQPEIC